MYSASLVDSGAVGLLNAIVIELPVERNDCICNFVSGLHICEIVVFLVSGVPSKTSIIDLQLGVLNIRLSCVRFLKWVSKPYVSR